MDVQKIVSELQALQRDRAVLIKLRTMQSNALQATIASRLGYRASMKETERKTYMKKAADLIKAVSKGRSKEHFEIINAACQGIDALLKQQEPIEEQMKSLLSELPIASWVAQDAQKGLGMQNCATLIGEIGNLSDYAKPGKVWRRMGCAPWSYDGKTLSGATWKAKREGKLPADQWMDFGYSPRRYAIAFVVADCLVKGNFISKGEKKKPGPYRARFEEAKKTATEKHKDWSKKRVDLHARKLCAKRLLRELWVAWRRGQGGIGEAKCEIERGNADVA